MGLNLPLLAFQHHVGKLYIDPAEIQFVCELSSNSDLAIVEHGRWHRADGSLCNVVCKVWRPFVVATPQDFRELLLEASKLHRLQHPNITRFLGLGCFSHGSLAEVRESMFMVEEYVGSRTLRKLISEQMRCRVKNLYNMQTALKWAKEVASALAALHEQQPPYVHNDVKADNVFLTDAKNLARATAKLGDLKPHRHVYDQEPCTLSQHQQQQRQLLAKQGRQSSLAKYTLERSSGSSGCTTSRMSWTGSTASIEQNHLWSVAVRDLEQQLQEEGKGADAQHAMVQQQQQEQQQLASSEHCGWQSSEGSSWPGACLTVQAMGQAAAAAAAAGFEPIARVRSLPVPITPRSSHALRTSTCPAKWEPGHYAAAGVDDGDDDASASYLSASSHGFSSPSSRSLTGSSPAELPNLLCAASSAPPAFDTLAAEILAADAAADATSAAAAAAADGMNSADVDDADDAVRGWAFRRRSGKTLFLSDSASSNSGSSSSRAKPKGLMSLAAAGDEDDATDAGAGVADAAEPLMQAALPPAGSALLQHHQHDQRAADTLHAQVQRPGGLAAAMSSWRNSYQEQQPQQQEDCASSVLAGAPHQNPLFRRSKSMTQDEDEEQQQLAQPDLLHMAKSAPAVLGDVVVAECKVHHGNLLEKHRLSEVPAVKQQQLSANVLHWHAKQLTKQQQRQQQQEQPEVVEDCLYYGWELSPSGAASPFGAVQSSMLDLFADLADDELVVNRRYRDFCQYTLVPGSFVQHKVVSSTTLAPLYSAPVVCSSKVPSQGGLWDAKGSNSNNSPGDSRWGTAFSNSSLQQPQQQQWQAAQPQIERSSSVGKGCAPSVMESKQHGGNSAFAALTAIDCIAEETSSMATDSCPPSCAPSRESSAHGGGHYWPSSPGSRDQQQQLLQQQGSSRLLSSQNSLPSLLSSGSLPRVLNLGALLPRRNSGVFTGDGGSSRESSREDEPRDTADGVPGDLLSCRAGSGSSSSHRSSQAEASPPSSPCQQQLLDGSSSGGGGSSTGSIYSGCEAGPLLLSGAAATSDGTRSMGGIIATSMQPLSPGSGYLDLSSGGGKDDDASPSTKAAVAGKAGRSPPAPAGGAASEAPTKRVRFTLERPAGATASRDFSLLYAAPELVRGERPTEKVDVFAFGVVLYELLSRSLVASHCAEVFAYRNSSRHRKRGGTKDRKQQQQQAAAAAREPDDGWGSNSSGPMPEQQLLLAYAQAVAGGYRPDMPEHFPEPVRQLVSSCWAAEPHERPRMSEVQAELQEWTKNKPLMSALNSYVHGLADMGYNGNGPSCGCSCVIS